MRLLVSGTYRSARPRHRVREARQRCWPLVLLCGGAAASANPALDRRYRIEAVKAGRMAGEGFEYVPHVRSERQKDDEERRRATGDYEAMRVHRAFFGFGVFSKYVHGNVPEEEKGDPNGKIYSALQGARLEAYMMALDACVASAVKQVTGLAVKSETDYHFKVIDATNRALVKALNNHGGLMELAAAMAHCLRGRGYAVEDAMRWPLPREAAMRSPTKRSG